MTKEEEEEDDDDEEEENINKNTPAIYPQVRTRLPIGINHFNHFLLPFILKFIYHFEWNEENKNEKCNLI